MSLINNRNYLFKLFFLLTIIITLLFRDIDFFLNPRFWAEEGAVYFKAAFDDGFLSIFYSHQGYFSLIPNVATYIATFIPLEYAPLFTTFIAFLIHLIPFVLILKSKSIYLERYDQKIIASLIVMFCTHTAEIWMNTITSQFHFIIILFLILIEKKENISKKYYIFLTSLVIIAGLSGVPANILTPFFLLQYIYTKVKKDLYYFIILSITTAIQIIYIIFISTRDRFSILDKFNMEKISIIQLFSFEYPIFYKISLTPLYLLITLVTIFIILKFSSTKKYFDIFFISSFFISCILILTSLGMYGGGRYSYAPSVIFLLGLLAIAYDKTVPIIARLFISLVLIVSIFIGIKKFKIPNGSFNSAAWIKWNEEVKLYKNGEKKILSIYPQWNSAHWKVNLDNKQ